MNFQPFPLNWSIGEPIDCYGMEERSSRVHNILIYGVQNSNLCIKIMKNTPANAIALLREYNNNMIVSNMPFTIKCYGLYILSNSQIGIIMQKAYIDGVLLKQRCNYQLLYKYDVHRLSSAHIFYQIALFISKLHDRGLLHLDIKLGNIVLIRSSGNFIYSGVIDFESLSETRNKQCYYTTTECFCSPEHCMNLPATEKDDVWAYGMMLMVYYTGFNPFSPDNNKDEYYKALQSKTFNIKKGRQFKNLPVELKKLILSCLQKDPSMRPTMKEVANNEFFYKQGLTENFVYSQISHMYNNCVNI